MNVTVEEMLKALSYEGCDCQPDYKADIGIVNGKCPKHKGRLLIKGEPVESLVARLRGLIRH